MKKDPLAAIYAVMQSSEPLGDSAFIEIVRKGLDPDDDLDSQELKTFEQLEFLGDGLLSALTADYLLEKYPNERPGMFTRMRMQFMGNWTLTCIAEELGWTSQTFTEISQGTRKRLADSFEALLAAIYLSGGRSQSSLETAKAFIKQTIGVKMDFLMRLADVRFPEEELARVCLERSWKMEIATERKARSKNRYKTTVYVDARKVSTYKSEYENDSRKHAVYEALFRISVLIGRDQAVNLSEFFEVA